TTIYVTHDQVEAMTMGDRVAVLRRGRLQQVAPPQELYERPAHLFVASFIGSPEMNLVEAELARGADGLVARVGDQELAVPPAVAAARPALAGLAGRRVGLGIRPEHLEDAALRAEGGRLRGRVVTTELLGAELLVHVEVAAAPVLTQEVLDVAADVDRALATDLQAGARAHRTVLVGRFDVASRVRQGDDVEVAVDVSKLHFFDLDTEQTIPVEGG
ncbi:MAG: TOBE domain-containing protein, partial [Candidatus Hydrogenedentes bacterium]|nr:TOBE domain-containing protein [Candidatus Hydrogenedentota bacterium]